MVTDISKVLDISNGTVGNLRSNCWPTSFMANCTSQGSLAGRWDLTVLGHILTELTYVTSPRRLPASLYDSVIINKIEVSRWDRLSERPGEMISPTPWEEDGK